MRSRTARLRPVHLAYAVKLVAYAGGALVVISATSNVGGITDVASWWSAPIAVQKFVVWTLLWEILGLGCGSLPLNFRFRPPIGGVLYWLQPETIRLPPWPERVPFTAGSRRQAGDVALYLVVLGSAVVLLCSGTTHGAPYDTLPAWPIGVLLVALGALGLRDRTPFLAARPEHYGVLLIVFLFPPTGLIFALKLVLAVTWCSAAMATLNRSFPPAVSVLVSIATRPPAGLLAYSATAVGLAAPVVLIGSRGGAPTVAAVTIMVIGEAYLALAGPLGPAPERGLFAGYATLCLFGHYASVGASSLGSTSLVVLLVVLGTMVVGGPVLGSLRPDLVSSLLARRGLAGNPASSIWLFHNDGAERRFDDCLVKPAPIVVRQLTARYDRAGAELRLRRRRARKARSLPGRALDGLLGCAVGDRSHYTAREGELVAGVALGWNLGDGHLHGRRLLDAVQYECDFVPGQLRVITLEARPLLRSAQRYQILDAADGLLEEGTVRLTDLLARPGGSGSPIPVQVGFRAPQDRPVDDMPTGIIKRQPANTANPKPRPRPGPGRARPAATMPAAPAGHDVT